jgi:hypothetical protein
VGARIILPLALEGAGFLASARDDDELAVRLWAAAAAERERSGFANMPADERLLDSRVAIARERLDPQAFADAWASGIRLGTAEAMACAMVLTRAAHAPGGGAQEPAGRARV